MENGERKHEGEYYRDVETQGKENPIEKSLMKRVLDHGIPFLLGRLWSPSRGKLSGKRESHIASVRSLELDMSFGGSPI